MARDTLASRNERVLRSAETARLNPPDEDHYNSIGCPECDADNDEDDETCILCGAELE